MIGISVDADTTLASWAREDHFPMLFASDVDGKVGSLYDNYDAARKLDARTLFVVDRGGKIAYVARPFRVTVQAAYTDLAAVIDNLEPLPADTVR